MPVKKQPGPIEQKLSSSNREKLKQLCRMDNQELFQLTNYLILADDADYDSELFHAAQALLEERAPLDEALGTGLSTDDFAQKYLDGLGKTELSASHPSKKSSRHIPARLLKSLIAAAVLIAACLSITALATGKNPVQFVSDMGEVLIHTITAGSSGDIIITDATSEYTSLEEAFSALGADHAQRITWIPKEFSLSSIDIQLTETGKTPMFGLIAVYSSTDAEILYNISYYPYSNSRMYAMEKNPEPYECWEIDEVEYYIVKNNNRVQAHWTQNGYSYTIVGEIPIEELKHIILSLK